MTHTIEVKHYALLEHIIRGKLVAYQESGPVTKTTKMGEDETHDVQEERRGRRQEEQAPAAVTPLPAGLFTARLSIERK